MTDSFWCGYEVRGDKFLSGTADDIAYLGLSVFKKEIQIEKKSTVIYFL